MRGTRGRIFPVLRVLLVLCAAGGLVYPARLAGYRRAVQELADSGVAIGALADGTYMGGCDVDFVRARAAVTVEDALTR